MAAGGSTAAQRRGDSRWRRDRRRGRRARRQHEPRRRGAAVGFAADQRCARASGGAAASGCSGQSAELARSALNTRRAAAVRCHRFGRVDRRTLAYYKCDETTGTTLSDSSGNGKNGTLVGPATFGPGKIGNALILTATNGVDGGASGGYAQLPAGLLTSIQTMTVAAWFMVNSNTKFQRVFDFGTSSTTSSMYFTRLARRERRAFLKFSIRTVLTDGGLNKEDLVGTTAITISPAWHHVAVVLDATGGHLYLDGGLASSNAAMTLRPADLGAMPNDWIGRSEFPNDPYFDGDIDEFRVYNRALTAAEVLALFNGQ